MNDNRENNVRYRSRQRFRFIGAAVAAGLVFLAAGGCHSGSPRAVRPSFELPESFSTAGTEPMPGQWWESFNDPGLEAVIERALANNFTIRAAWDRLTQAEQVAVQAGAALYPSATYSGGAERAGRETANIRTYNTDYFLGAGASYEVDLWGRVRSTRQAAVLDAAAAAETVNAAAMTLTATIAKTWYQLAEARRQEQIIARQIHTNEKILEVIKVQFRQGQIGAADVFSQQQLVQSSRGQLIQAQERIALLAHQLSILSGQVPTADTGRPPADLITLPPLPVIAVPAVVIQRRPDVRTAYRSVQAADRRMAAAIADQYPAVSLSTAAETSGPQVKDLFDDWLANLAGNVAGPLFDGGLRKAEVHRTRAVLSERLNLYGQAVLEALQETEDAISQETYQRQYVDSLQRQLELAEHVYERTYQNYLKGQQDYIRVLTALVSMQRLEQNELTARRVLIERRIDLCRSIAGGWGPGRPDTEEIISQSLYEDEAL